MGSSGTDLWGAKSSMIALSLLKPLAKPILALLFCLFIYLIFHYHNGLQQKIGQFETTLAEKQQIIDTQNQNIDGIKKQIVFQAQAIADLQQIQAELQEKSEQKKITIREILSHDPEAKSWASQPVPDSIRSMFNSTSPATTNSILSSSNRM